MKTKTRKKPFRLDFRNPFHLFMVASGMLFLAAVCYWIFKYPLLFILLMILIALYYIKTNSNKGDSGSLKAVA